MVNTLHLSCTNGLIPVKLSCNPFYILLLVVTPLHTLFIPTFVDLCPNGLLLHDRLRRRVRRVHMEEDIQHKVFSSREADNPLNRARDQGSNERLDRNTGRLILKGFLNG